VSGSNEHKKEVSGSKEHKKEMSESKEHKQKVSGSKLSGMHFEIRRLKKEIWDITQRRTSLSPVIEVSCF
jgi:hypothetical protein